MAKSTILFIDDNPRLLRSYEQFFTEEGFNFLGCQDGEEGVALAKHHHPHAILLDLMLPNTDGLSLLQKIKQDEDLKTIPIIVITALVNDQKKDESLNLGADEYVGKVDLEPDQLLKIIRKHVKHETVS